MVHGHPAKYRAETWPDLPRGLEEISRIDRSSCRGTNSSNPSPSSGESSELGVALTWVATSKNAAFAGESPGRGSRNRQEALRSSQRGDGGLSVGSGPSRRPAPTRSTSRRFWPARLRRWREAARHAGRLYPHRPWHRGRTRLLRTGLLWPRLLPATHQPTRHGAIIKIVGALVCTQLVVRYSVAVGRCPGSLIPAGVTSRLGLGVVYDIRQQQPRLRQPVIELVKNSPEAPDQCSVSHNRNSSHMALRGVASATLPLRLLRALHQPSRRSIRAREDLLCVALSIARTTKASQSRSGERSKPRRSHRLPRGCPAGAVD